MLNTCLFWFQQLLVAFQFLYLLQELELTLLEKDKLNTFEVLISKNLIDSYINHDEFVLVNNVLREYQEMKEEVKNPEISVEYTI